MFYVAQVITLQRVFGATTSNTIYVKVLRCKPKAHRIIPLLYLRRGGFAAAPYIPIAKVPLTKVRGIMAHPVKVQNGRGKVV